MAEKKVTNAAQIAAAQAANRDAQAQVNAALARAEAANNARRPILQQSVAGIAGFNQATQNALNAINSNAPQSVIDKALKAAKTASVANKTNIASITPEQQQMAIEQGQIYSSSMADVERYNAMMTAVPEAIYETGPTLAKDAFINTFKLIVGDTEGSKSYVAELYDYVSKYYKSGFTVAEALNLSLRDAKSAGVMPAFTDRFKAVFALEDLKRQGKIVDVPTIAEYVKSEQALGEVLNRAGLGDLATEATLANVFSTGKSVAETTSIINDVFLAIDNAPTAWKANVAKVIPFADRTSLARAVLLGEEGAQALQKTVAKAGVLTAAEQQGLTLSSAQQSELVASGESFGTSLGKFAQTRGILDVAQKLKSMEMGIAPKDAYTQEQAMAATFNQSYDELQNLAKLSEREQARFAARPGLMGSKSLASQNRISY